MKTIKKPIYKSTITRSLPKQYEDQSIHVEEITPTRASRILARSDKESFDLGWKNRPLNRKWVNAIAVEMQRGQWRPNGKAIIISKEGIIGDGQHRINAVIKSGSTIYSHVYHNGDLEDFATWGWVKPRTLADTFSSGCDWMKHGAAKASLVSSFLILYDAQMGKPRRKLAASHTEGKEIWRDNPDLLESFEFCRSLGAVKFCNGLYKASKLYACHCMFTRVAGSDEADEFIRKLISGTNMSEHDPVYVLREKLFRLKHESSYVLLKYNTSAGRDILEYNYLIYAWNKTREGKTINRISLGPNKSTKMIRIK
jgi:hypothetical protein